MGWDDGAPPPTDLDGELIVLESRQAVALFDGVPHVVLDLKCFEGVTVRKARNETADIEGFQAVLKAADCITVRIAMNPVSMLKLASAMTAHAHEVLTGMRQHITEKGTQE